MADDSDVVILCDPSVLGGKQSRLSGRETKSGAMRYHISVESQPLIHSFDPRTLGKPVADAMAESLREKIRNIAATASAGTLRARDAAARAYAKGAPWAQKRYAGGRIGAMPPGQTERAFNDSGRFAQSIAVGAADDAWRINVASNRLDPSTTGGELGVRRIWAALVRHVPAFGRPLELFNERGVQQGLKESLGALIVKAEARREALTKSLAMAKINAVKQVLGLLAG